MKINPPENCPKSQKESRASTESMRTTHRPPTANTARPRNGGGNTAHSSSFSSSERVFVIVIGFLFRRWRARRIVLCCRRRPLPLGGEVGERNHRPPFLFVRPFSDRHQCGISMLVHLFLQQSATAISLPGGGDPIDTSLPLRSSSCIIVPATPTDAKTRDVQ